MKVEVNLAFDAIRITFNGVLHARIQRSKILGVQSWSYGENNYFIEYALCGGSMLCEYDNVDKWKTILEGLDRVL